MTFPLPAPAANEIGPYCRAFLHGSCAAPGCECRCHPQAEPIPHTQIESLDEVAGAIPKQRARVLDALRRTFMTDREIAAECGIDLRPASARRGELVTDGLVSRSGGRRREGPRNLWAAEWMAAAPADPVRLARQNRRKLILKRLRKGLNDDGQGGQELEERLTALIEWMEGA